MHALNRGWALLAALTYGVILAFMPGEGILDRENYLTYLHTSQIVMLDWTNLDVMKILANEPIWILINAGMSLLFPPEQSIRILILFPATIVSYSMLRIDSRYVILLLAFLLLPQVLKNHVVHLRQGFGVAVFLLGWFAHSSRWRYGLWLLTPFIHSSFFFVLFIFFTVHLCQHWRFSMPLVWSTILLAGTGIGFGLREIALAVGARQGEESLIAPSLDISGLGFFFWMFALLLLLIQPRSFKWEHSFEISTIIFYLATYFLSPFSARIFESTLPLVLLSGLQMHGFGRVLFLILMVIYIILNWLNPYLLGVSIFVEI
jgi:hypothetical protein